MRKSITIVLFSMAAILAVAAPIAIAVKVASKQGLDREKDFARAFAADVVRRSDETAGQGLSGLAKLLALHSADPCSPEMMATMRAIDLASSYIQAVGHVSGNAMDCSSISPRGDLLPLGPVEYITKTGVRTRTNVEFAFAKGVEFLVFERDGFAMVVHKQLPIDVTTPSRDVILGAVKLGQSELFSSNGVIRPRWIAALNNGPEASFIDDGYVVSTLRSRKYPIGAVAAVPVADVDVETRQLFRWLLPFGIFGGLVLAWTVFHFARLQLAMPAMIRSGLRNDEFFMLYQPLVDLATREWLGAEALISWRRSHGELVRPDLFIPLAEDSGEIEHITERVIKLVAKDAKRLFKHRPEFHIGLNLAAADMHSAKTIERLRWLVKTTGARPGSIMVEATERGFVKADLAGELLHDIRAAGILVAIDDFGTGYSSLSQLGNLELDFLKIDKSFVDTLGTGAATSQVAEHIINMAKGLHLHIIAEGVETEEQARILHEHGVELGQGWLFSKPLQFADLLRRLDA